MNFLSSFSVKDKSLNSQIIIEDSATFSIISNSITFSSFNNLLILFLFVSIVLYLDNQKKNDIP